MCFKETVTGVLALLLSLPSLCLSLSLSVSVSLCTDMTYKAGSEPVTFSVFLTCSLFLCLSLPVCLSSFLSGCCLTSDFYAWWEKEMSPVTVTQRLDCTFQRFCRSVFPPSQSSGDLQRWLTVVQVATFKLLEGREVDMMRDLRARNMEKANGGEGDNRFCICRKGAFGFMLQCELCKDWFHGWWCLWLVCAMDVLFLLLKVVLCFGVFRTG